MSSNAIVPVLAAPLIDPGTGRIEVDLPHGLTIAEMIIAVMPGARWEMMRDLRIVLLTDEGAAIIERQRWHRVRPKAGVRVVIRMMPGKGLAATLLQIVVSVASIALGQFYGPMLAASLGISRAAGVAIVGLAATVVGGLIISALIPPPKSEERRTTYQISGWRNRLDPDAVVPALVGSLRYAPPFAATSYYEVVGDILYVRSLFLFGYGQVDIDDMRIGETSIGDYDEVQIELRYGIAGELPVSLYPQQLVEESISTELVRPKPRNDAGKVISGPSIETPVIRTTGFDASGVSVIVGFPGGLLKMSDDGDRKNRTVSIRIRQRLAGATLWNDVVTLDITAKKSESLFRQYTWTFPVRGRYEIELTRMTDEAQAASTQDRSQWMVLQTLRPEYPINMSVPLALAAVRVKSTYQLQGQLDAFNAKVSRVCLDWDVGTGTWIARQTRNPASIFRWALQGPHVAKPVADSGIDLVQLQSWHAFCVANGLSFDRPFDGDMSLRDMLTEITSAGRASQRHDGLKWGVVVDRPKEMFAVDEINARNSWNFQRRRTYFTPPHAFRVKFLDATNDYKPAERVVPWPGHTGEIVVTEALEMPGKTDPAEIYLGARRRMYEAIHRPDVYNANQGGAARVATRGDMVLANIDMLDKHQISARVVTAAGHLVELDEIVAMVAGTDYVITFRVFADEDDAIGTAVTRRVVTDPGVHRSIVLQGNGELPLKGWIIHFGTLGNDSRSLLITRVEAGKDFTTVYQASDAAPIIDDLMATEVAPAWSGRVGTEIDANLLQPPAPKFTSIESGHQAGDDGTTIAVELAPGSGPIASMQYQVEHHIAGGWTSIVFPAANGGCLITGYSRGDAVQIRAKAISGTGVSGPYGPTVTITVGGDDANIPVALDSSMVNIGAVLGGAIIMFSSADDAAATQLQIYRSGISTLNTTTDKLGSPHAIEASRGYSIPDGDTTRTTLLINGAMDTGGTWTLGSGFGIGSGTLNKTAGSASDAAQPITLHTGKYVRLALDITAWTAGSLTPALKGGTTRAFTARSAVGSYSDRIQSVTGNNSLALSASSTFAGSIDNVVAFEETATCLAAGTYYYWLEPQNDDGVGGPIAGPFSVTIR